MTYRTYIMSSTCIVHFFSILQIREIEFQLVPGMDHVEQITGADITVDPAYGM